MTQTQYTDPAVMEGFFTGLSPKDRANIEKHLAACDSENVPDHGRLWRRLAVGMRQLGPLRPQTTGQRAIQFFAADGRYRIQLFAIEDARDGNIAVYVGDVLQPAIASGILRGPVGTGDEAELYEVCEMPDTTLKVETLSAANSAFAPDYYRHMMGWNRRAVRVTLPTSATPAQVRATEALLALAAGRAVQASQA